MRLVLVRAGAVRVAGDDDAVHVLGVFVIGEELLEDVDELVERRLRVGLDLGRAHVEEHALAEDDVAAVADADLGGVAHDLGHAVADLLEDRQAQHRDGLHLAAHGKQLLRGGFHVFLLRADQGFLIRQELVLCGQLLLLLGKL